VAVTPVDRLSRADTAHLRGGARAAAPWNVAALLIIDDPPRAPDGSVDLDLVRRELDRRTLAVPRLRRRVMRAPLLCGGPYWADDPRFDIAGHVFRQEVAAPGDRAALPAAASSLRAARIDRSRPPWQAVVLDGPGPEAGLVLVMDHVLADGLAGLAVLAALADPGPEDLPARQPAPLPTRTALFADAGRCRIEALRGAAASLRHPLNGLRGIRRAVGAFEVRSRAAATSFNRPIGTARALAVVEADLAATRAAAHRLGGTLNDLALALTGRGLHRLLAARGEAVSAALYASVPLTLRATAAADDLGNRTVAARIRLPATASLAADVAALAPLTRAAKERRFDPAAIRLFEWVSGFLALAGLGERYQNRQRLINVFVTNVAGPPQEVSFLGARVSEIVPMVAPAGNVPLSVVVFSYAGRLLLALNADAGLLPDLAVVTESMAADLAAVTGPSAPPPAA
jgi:WS/DGAT/MGAT family acyltransferase